MILKVQLEKTYLNCCIYNKTLLYVIIEVIHAFNSYRKRTKAVAFITVADFSTME